MDGPPDAPPLVLGPSLGTSLDLWRPQLAALSRRHRVIRWDLPGHGGSPVGAFTGRHTVDALADAVLRLTDALRTGRFGYAGVSLGGAVGASLAVRRPDRVASLALVCTSAWFGPPQPWRERAALVRAHGTGPVADRAAARWFTPRFAGSPPALALVAGLRTGTDPEGYAACCEALAAFDLRGELSRVAAPTLVVAGREDLPTPPSHARELADGIPGAALTEIPGAGHLANVERPAAVTAALLGHLSGPAAHASGS